MTTPPASFSPDRRTALKLAGLGLLSSLAGARRALAAEPGPAPLATEFVYEALVTLEPAVEVGPAPTGRRRYIPITGGTFAGPRLRGVVLPGGADWQTDRADGVTEIDALYSMRCDDGAVIIVHNRGLIAGGGTYLRTTPRFEAPQGPHAWLNESVYAGSITVPPQPGAVIIRVFRIL